MTEKIKSIISQMTLEEKASLCSGKDWWRTKPVERLGIPSVMVSDGPSGLRTQIENGSDENTEPIGDRAAICIDADTNITLPVNNIELLQDEKPRLNR